LSKHPERLIEVQHSIDDLFEQHDTDPHGVGTALREFRSVPEKDLVRFSWLVNHVIGEKQTAWPDAFSLMLRVLPRNAPPSALLNFGACAYLAGAPIKAMALEVQVSKALACHEAHARCLIQLRVLQCAGGASDADDFAAVLCECLSQLEKDSFPEKFVPMYAASLNNVVSLLLEHERADHQSEPIRSVLLAGSEQCRALWRRAGTWVNHERADYLVALCANKVGQWEFAQTAALDGLATIDANGPEDVDRAFLLLELARAQHGLGQTEKHEAARFKAFELAASFDPKLRAWFESRATE
jgi:hypothetical protein